ncbi:MAG: S-layer homology domain-containing protein [Bacillota bacterium]
MKKLLRFSICLCLVVISVFLFSAAAQAAVSNPIVSGTEYTVSTLPTTGKITAFNKLLEISYPKNNTLVDSNKITAVDQTVYFTVFLPSGGSPDYQKYTLVSNIYKITTAAQTYLLDPGQIKITYDTNVSSAVANQLAVWYSPGITVAGGTYEWDGTNNINLGGVTDSRKCTVAAPLQFSGTGTGYYGVFLAQQSFSEFNAQSDNSWAYSCVMPLWAKGIVEPLPVGGTAGVFGVANDVYRLEFATMLVRGLGLTLTDRPSSAAEQIFEDAFGGTDFCDATPEDISSSYFGAGYSAASGYKIYDTDRMPVQYAETAARNGIVVGYLNGSAEYVFQPAGFLTREEAAVILARVSNLKLSDDGEKVLTDLEKVFEDATLISPWAAPSVLAVQKAKLIAGKPSSDPDSSLLQFDPDGNLTRAEATALAYRFLKKQKKI